MTVHPLVRAVVETFLDAVDDEAAGLVEGLYLIGSVALDDFRPHQSDIDFVAVTAARPDARGRAALRRAHARLRARYGRPFFDGIHLTWQNLAHGPDLCDPVPFTHDGRFCPAGRFELNPVTWHILARHGVTFRGPAPADADIRTDPESLATWTLGNLDSYWRRWRERSGHLFSPLGLATLGTWAPAWGVLGVARLHYTLATGDITSKTGAGTYALDTFPERWHRLIKECLHIRRGTPGPSLYNDPLTRRRDTLAFITMVMDDAHRLDIDRTPTEGKCPTTPSREGASSSG